MNEKELYEKQYGEKKIITAYSFPFVRKRFKIFDLPREDLAVNLLDGGKTFLDVGCGSGSLAFKPKEKFNEVYGLDTPPSRLEEAKNIAVERFGNTINIHFSPCNINEKIGLPDKNK